MVRLASEPALHFFELAQVLTKLHDTDPRLLRDLPDTSEISRRRMYYLIRTGTLLRDKRVSREQAETIGWTKLQIIARHMHKAGSSFDFQELLDLASKHNARDLPAALRGGKVVPRRVVHFYLNVGERAELNEALIEYGAKRARRGLSSKEAALIRLVRAAKAGQTTERA